MAMLPRAVLLHPQARVHTACPMNIQKHQGVLIIDMVAVKYYKLSINGNELIEVNAVNLVRKVGGTDQLAAIRAAIGL
ncbi:hypothetical protein CKO42_08850 [Lamprobacter modestohalophilus]|uniref:Uncharacterized protein n=1 Tax=Lamprobacter modestohalophilus TaxID=1064514 RepID=A0A9X0W850_9GAMM|nr:phage major tail tube protein [Lamprobacter modestohalophilus]MBK1618545.1 hypothetical protein [Lamprobacter modestohalophilus]